MCFANRLHERQYLKAESNRVESVPEKHHRRDQVFNVINDGDQVDSIHAPLSTLNGVEFDLLIKAISEEEVVKVDMVDGGHAQHYIGDHREESDAGDEEAFESDKRVNGPVVKRSRF